MGDKWSDSALTVVATWRQWQLCDRLAMAEEVFQVILDVKLLFLFTYLPGLSYTYTESKDSFGCF